jgi:redox-sensitive bicupin YhaK (pirin superfamily)
MLDTIIHPSETRGHANHGWLDSKHTFSFAGYFNPERIHFGALRVLNDDTVEPGMGFDIHPHDNMEIISIPLEGELAHKDSMGNVVVIKKGDIQVMSAGSGIFHSEYNYSSERIVKFLQIWILPNKKNVSPRYEQFTLDPSKNHNKLQQIVSPDKDDAGLWIHQNAWFHLGKFDKGISTIYKIKSPGNGVYAFIIKGKVNVNQQILMTRDGLGIQDEDKLVIKADTDSEILLMEVPMIY